MKIELNKDKNAGLIVTILFHTLLLIVLTLMSLTPPTPQPPQIYTEVDLGNSGGSASQEEQTTNSTQETPVPKSTSSENIATQNSEQTVKINHSKKVSTTQNDVETPEEPALDSRFIANKNKLNSNGPNSNGPNNGPSSGPGPGPGNNPGPGGTGKVNLPGRIQKALPKPAYDVDEQGTVVVKIWVDQNGKVTAAEAGVKPSNTTNSRLLSLAYQAAMKSMFDYKPDAPISQIGYITYIFQLK